MATTTTHNQQDRAGAVTPLGFELTWPDGTPYLDPETDAADAIPARYTHHTDAAAVAAMVGDWAAEHLGLPWTLTVVPAGTRPAPRPALAPTATAPASAAAEAVVVRTTVEYAIRLPDGHLWRDADAQVAGWDATRFLSREDAEDAADKLTTDAAEAGIRGYRAAVAARTITTTISDWH